MSAKRCRSYGRTHGRALLQLLKTLKQGHVSIATTLRDLAAGPIAEIVHEYTQEHPHVRIAALSCKGSSPTAFPMR